jgi:AcrR family transcriptional regulator
MDRPLISSTGSAEPAPEEPPPEQPPPEESPPEAGLPEARAPDDPLPEAPPAADDQPIPADGLPDPTGNTHVRRPPYGRNPTLAAHGVRARAEIIAAARELFARQGYQATTVESIGEATGRSGAAVYQYFEGKAEIFGIFLQESGAELKVLGERFPLLTDDAAGELALEQWISELMDLLGRHQSIFLMWAPIQYSEPALADIGRDNLGGYQHGIAAQLAAAGAHPPTPAIAPVGILSVVQWSYFMFLVRNPPISRQRLQAALAGILRSYLFAGWESAPSPVTVPVDDDQMPTIPLGDAMGLRRPVTARGVGTVQRILLAAADRFRVAGYLGTSLSDVAAAAGVSHASVYTYWADRDALFATLARDAVAAVRLRVGTLPAALRSPDGLGGWIEGWVAMLFSHGAVLYVWTHEVDDPRLADLTSQMHELVDRAGLLLIAASGSEPVADPAAMGVVLRAVLTDVPYALSAQLGILPRDATCAFVSGLLAAGAGAPAGGSALQ